MIDNFYRATTLAFGVYVYKSKCTQLLEGTVSLMLKANKSDSDSDAVINTEATDYDMNKARFVLEPTETDIDVGTYFYEITWTTSAGQVYILESDTVSVLEKVGD